MLAPALFLLLAAGEAKVSVEAPAYHVAGAPFRVQLSLEAPADGARLEGWQLTPAGFTVDGKALAEPGKLDALQLAGGEKKTIELDLGPSLTAAADFQLGWGDLATRTVRVLAAAPKDLKFLDEAALSAEALAQYWVLLRTNRGDVLVEFWPDVAPGHVRNFLDLSATGFYDDTTFHRVIPGFMIQGGDPNGDGSGGGPRRLKAEFSDRKHVRGVLSAARQGTPNTPGPKDPLKDTASSQFFLMHKNSTHLDGNYSAFGKVVAGMAVVDRIVQSPRSPQDRPHAPQVILKALVVQMPADPASFHESQ